MSYLSTRAQRLKIYFLNSHGLNKVDSSTLTANPKAMAKWNTDLNRFFFHNKYARRKPMWSNPWHETTLEHENGFRTNKKRKKLFFFNEIWDRIVAHKMKITALYSGRAKPLRLVKLHDCRGFMTGVHGGWKIWTDLHRYEMIWTNTNRCMVELYSVASSLAICCIGWTWKKLKEVCWKTSKFYCWFLLRLWKPFLSWDCSSVWVIRILAEGVRHPHNADGIIWSNLSDFLTLSNMSAFICIPSHTTTFLCVSLRRKHFL